MLDNLDATVRLAVMKILAAVYESGFAEEVDVRLLLQLFGVASTENDEMPSWIIKFDEPGFYESYVKFKEEEIVQIREIANFIESDMDLDGLDAFDEDFPEPEPDKEGRRIIH